MNTISIIGLHRVPHPKPNKGGNTIVAHFDCEANGFRLLGCALVKTLKGGLSAWTPRVDGMTDARRAVVFADDSLQHEMKMLARDAYRALGGTDLECIGASAPIGSYRGAGDK
ncbi:MAG TPA: hypothetical protein ENH55_12175 [Aurantimonas coralicida]|uniref:Uncharacterized protein n=2 Tax=root TaxID=1 RepID=A0A9C9TIK6_9HYPH|nr:hypothetical protein [Aurantimonas coralicida]HEU02610.1 hypothetical protein [Aurantimonas coralicida]